MRERRGNAVAVDADAGVMEWRKSGADCEVRVDDQGRLQATGSMIYGGDSRVVRQQAQVRSMGRAHGRRESQTKMREGGG